MSESSDADLLRRWQTQESEDDFRTLVVRYAGLVHQAALRTCGDRQLASEASQMTFITLARKAASLAGRDSLAGWLHITAMMQAKNLLQHHSRESRKRQHLGQHLEMMSPDPPLSIWKNLEPLLDEALAALREKDREAILLRHYRALSIREIATNLSISAEAAQKRVDRAMERLRSQLSRRGHSTGASLSATLLAGLAADAEAGIPLANSLASKALAAGPPTAASFLSTLLFLSLMKKIAITLAVLALVGAGIAVFKPDGKRDRPATSTPASTAVGNTRAEDLPDRAKVTKAAPFKERIRLLEETYGADRTARSRDAASVCIAQSLKSAEFFGRILELEKDSFTWRSFPFAMGDMKLSQDQETAANGIALRFATRQVALQRTCLERLAADPTPLLELLLASDACSRGELPEAGYTSLRASLADRVKGATDPVGSSGRNVDFGTMETPQTEATFISEFRAILTTPGQLELFDAMVKKANDPRTARPNPSSFAALEPTDLGLLSEKMNATLKLVGGLLDQTEAAGKLPEGD